MTFLTKKLRLLERWTWRRNWIGSVLRSQFEKRQIRLENIPGDQLLYRAIDPGWVKPGGVLSAAAFRESSGVSLDLEIYSNIDRARKGNPVTRENFGLMQFLANGMRGVDVEPYHDPLFDSEEQNYAHSQLRKISTQQKIVMPSKGFARTMGKHLAWVVQTEEIRNKIGQQPLSL